MSVKAARQWFRMEAAEGDTVAEIHIIDFIGGWIDDFLARNWGYETGVTAKAFIDDLQKLPASVKALKVHINSPGGDVFGALNIANALRAWAVNGRTVETIVDGLAASSASIVMMAGSKVTVADNALVMVHHPWTCACGNATQMRAAAGELDKVTDTIVATYRWHSALEPNAIRALLDGPEGADGTYMDADEALANGFATDKVEGLRAAAALDRSRVRALRVPDKYRARLDALVRNEETGEDDDEDPAAEVDPDENGQCPDGYELGEDGVCHLVSNSDDEGDDSDDDEAPQDRRRGRLVARAGRRATAAELLPLCQAAGASMAFLAELLADKVTLTEAQARIAKDKTNRQAAVQREKEIKALCAGAQASALADGYIRGGMSVADVKAHLVTITALVDGKVQVDGGLGPDVGTEAAAAGWKAAFAKVNRRRPLAH